MGREGDIRYEREGGEGGGGGEVMWGREREIRN